MKWLVCLQLRTTYKHDLMIIFAGIIVHSCAYNIHVWSFYANEKERKRDNWARHFHLSINQICITSFIQSRLGNINTRLEAKFFDSTFSRRPALEAITTSTYLLSRFVCFSFKMKSNDLNCLKVLIIYLLMVLTYSKAASYRKSNNTHKHLFPLSLIHINDFHAR